MRRMKDSLEAALAVLGDLVSGAAFRAAADLKHVGEVVQAFVGDGNDAGIDIDQNKKDVWLTFTDVLSGMKDVGRLFIPAQILFRVPRANDGAHVVRGRKMRGPGASLVMPDGGDGSSSVVPGWDDNTNLDKNNAGILLPEGFHLESTGDRVRIVANSGGTKSVIELQKGGKITITAAGGQVVEVNGNSSKAILDTLLADLATALGYIPTGASTTYPGLVPNVTQWAAFITKLTSGAYQSNNVKYG